MRTVCLRLGIFIRGKMEALVGFTYLSSAILSKAPKRCVIHSLSMGERGIGRLWSWAQYARTARRVSFRRLTLRHLSFDMVGKAGSTTLTIPEVPKLSP